METPKNMEYLIQELKNEVKILNELLTKQATLIGLKDLILYRCQERIDELEADKEELIGQSRNLFWSLDRSN
ncbi:MAG: hypothetical protein U0X91_03490 [Spirosomataceae bacterium]